MNPIVAIPETSIGRRVIYFKIYLPFWHTFPCIPGPQEHPKKGLHKSIPIQPSVVAEQIPLQSFPYRLLPQPNKNWM